MKKTLMKIGMIAAILLTTNSFRNSLVHSIPICKPIPTFSNLVAAKDKGKLHHNSLFTHMLALQNKTNLKAYHFGLSTLIPTYKIPTEKNLLNTIYSHPFFIGKLSNAKNLQLNQPPFFIFETSKNGKSHFYVAHSKGMRHFTVNTFIENGHCLPRVDNATDQYFPSVKQFLQSTIT